MSCACAFCGVPLVERRGADVDVTARRKEAGETGQKDAARPADCRN